MIWFAGAIFVVGLCLLAWAVRGRRVDDHPLCRKCRFDLIGLYPDVETCPECGRGVKGERDIRIGHRKARRRLGVLAVVVMMVSGSGAGLVALGRAQGIDWYDYKPAWWLRLEIVHGSTKMVDDAVAEFMDRQSAKKLNAMELSDLVDALLRGLEKGGQRPPHFARALVELYDGGALSSGMKERVIKWALAAQVTPKIEWSSDLGRLVVEEGVGDRIPKEQYELFLKQAHSPRLELGVKGKLRPGESVPVYLVSDERGGPVNGVVIGSVTGLDGRRDPAVGRLQDGVAYLGKVTAPTTPGKHAIEGDVSVMLKGYTESMARQQMMRRNSPDTSLGVRMTWPLKLEYEVGGEGELSKEEMARRVFFVTCAQSMGRGIHVLNLSAVAPGQEFRARFSVGWKYEGKESHAGMGSVQVSSNSFSYKYSSGRGSGTGSSYGSTKAYFPFRMDVAAGEAKEGSVVLHIEEFVVKGEDLGPFELEIPGVRVRW